MADFNKIFTTSSLNVNKVTESKICFNDGEVIFASKYSLANNTLLLSMDTTKTVSIYCNHGISTNYEFDIDLNRDNVKLPSFDNYEKTVEDVIPNRSLIFINGLLQDPSEYTIENGKDIYIKHSHDTNKSSKVFIYSSSIEFTRVCYDKNPDTSNPKLDSLKEEGQDYLFDSIRVPGTYNTNNTLVFINGKKIDFNIIEDITLNKNSYSYIKINEDVDEATIDTLEFVIFDNSYDNTEALHFETEQGYSQYGPLDYFGKSIPNAYNITFTLNDQAKLIVDNIRYGFILKEVNGYGEAIITDTSFETRTIKGLIVQNFNKNTYDKTEFYFEVPEYTNIVKYLAEYDTKYTFLPEILTVFQRLVLDEIQDTIQRLRDSRSIYKVDSVSINKLLGLLGSNLNIKTLNKKQRRELLEELNEFYRIAGTRDSYNLLNILQNNLKLIDMQQLFTPNGSYNEFKHPVYNYKSDVTEPGTGYQIGDHLKTELYPNLEGIVKEVDPETGGIVDFELFTQTGRDELTLTTGLVPAAQGIFNCTSTVNYYNYSASEFIGSHDFREGQILHTYDNSFNVKVTNTDNNGRILNFVLSPTSGATNYTLKDVQLYESSAAFYRVQVTSKATGDYIQIYKKNYSDLSEGTISDLQLEPGMYKIVIAGAGGGGGAGDTEKGWNSDVECQDGYSGEVRTEYVSLKSPTTVTGKIGQGGGGAKAQGTWYWDQTNAGNGYDKGKLGQNLRGAWGYKHGWIITSGQGGGSSGIKIGSTTIIAKGGNGGSAGGRSDIGTTQVVAGGQGGSGGTTTGTGPKGGTSGYHKNDFWSSPGANGYIIIYKCNQVTHYITPLDDISAVEQGDQFELKTPYQSFIVTAYKQDNKIFLEPDPLTTTKYVNESSNDTPSMLMTKLGINLSAKLNLTSTAARYKYKVSLKGLNIDYLKIGDEFRNSDAATNKQFVYKITNIDRNSNTYSGEATKVVNDYSQPITLTDTETYAYYKTGTGAQLSITYQLGNQTLYDRCYIDFYTKKELGAELKTKYVMNATDYLLITEGTPHSPKWWDCTGNVPDIDYGSINYSTENVIDYGLVSQAITGKWVKWWEWDRQSIWYPTNHVIAEMKMPIDVNFSDFSKQFVEQFYNLASTVVYLHGVINSFYYGKESVDNTNPKSNNGSTFGISCGAPIMTYEATVTSNPYIQYKQHTPETVTLTITPIPEDAMVTLIYGEGDDQVIIAGQGSQSIEIPYDDPKYNNMVTWKVERAGYKPKSRVRCVKETKEKFVMLESQYNRPVILKTLTIDPTPNDATVTFTAAGYEQEGNSITVEYGTTVLYNVAKENYRTVKATAEVTSDTTLEVTLSPLEYYTVVVRANPAAATITLEAPGYETVVGQGTQEITVIEGTTVTYTVNCDNYATYSNTITPTENTTIDVTLQTGVDLSDYDYTITPEYDVTLIDYIGEGTTITTPHI